jgi:glycosyltransferase involved in cell wall biosynthesis
MLTREPPIVSVMVCTWDRPTMLRRALASVTRSAAIAAVPIEVIVVVDGEGVGAEPHLVQSVEVVTGPRAGVGAARRAGLATARGKFVAYCDDDDEWTPDHLMVLLDHLRQHAEAALVYGDVHWRSTDPAFPAVAPFRVPARGPVTDIHASAVLHRTSAARDVGGFDPSFSAYEDIDLWFRIDEAHRLHHVPNVVALLQRHAGCVTATEHTDLRDRLLRFHHHRRPCREHSSTAPAPASTFDPVTWSPPRRELLWQSPLNPYQGFGIASRELLLAVERAGVDVTLASPPGPAAPEFARLVKTRSRRKRIALTSEYWHQPDAAAAGLQVVATMREGTWVPKARVNALNQTAALVYLPCRQNLESFRESGLRVPSKVLPFGINPQRFPYLERPRTGAEPFMFGTCGVMSPRKGIDVLVRAFRIAFHPREPVRLLLKSVDPTPLLHAADPRIEMHLGFWRHEQMLTFLQQLDSFVLPSRAEGFGLCGLEAMATGLPLIATNWSGPADYLDPADSFPLAFHLVDADATESNGVRYFGRWAEPEEEHLAGLMRWLYEHPAEARVKGRQASARIHAYWTWDRAAHQLRDDLDQLATGASPA